MVSIKEIESFKDYGRCICVTNGVIEAYVTVDIGPRIIRFGYVDGQNMMCSNRKAFGPKDDKEFTAYFGEGKHWENLGRAQDMAVARKLSRNILSGFRACKL